MGQMTELWLVRHGQTDWNLEGRYQGQADIPLNQTGINQAQQLGLSLPEQPFRALYSSDLIRARQTAEILGKRFNLQVVLDRRLREIYQGEWEGQLIDEIRSRFQDLSSQERRLIYLHPPGGEAVAEVAERMKAAVDEMARSHSGEKVLVVSHGLSLATLICQARDIPMDQVYFQIPENARATCINWMENGRLNPA